MRAAADRVSRWLHPRQWGLVALFFALYELAAETGLLLLCCALPEAEAESIRRSLTGKMSQVDQVMAQAGQMVSSMVGYPAYAMADHTQAEA